MDQQTVRQWLDDVELDAEDHDVEEGFEWALLSEPKPFRAFIARPAVPWPQLAMQVNVAISPDHMEPFVELPEDDRDGFLFDLRLALNAHPVGHQLAFEAPEDARTLRQVRFRINLFEDPLTRAGFLRRHFQLQSAGITVSLMFQKMARFRRWPV